MQGNEMSEVTERRGPVYNHRASDACSGIFQDFWSTSIVYVLLAVSKLTCKSQIAIFFHLGP